MKRLPGSQDYRRWSRFLISGTINTAVDFAIFAALLRWSDFGPFHANLIAFAAAICCSFLLNRFWTFGERRGSSPVVFLLWMTAIALLSSWLLHHAVQMGMHVAAAKIIVTLMVVVLSYQAMNRLIFVNRRARIAMVGGLAALAAAGGLSLLVPAGIPRGLPDDLAALYPASPRPPVKGPLRVFHLGHSLVGRTMPYMVAQLAGEGHDYGFQLGWGTTLSAHLAGPDEIHGFTEENASPHFVPLPVALADSDLNALVFTEMIGLEAAIRYYGSTEAVIELSRQARAANPDLELLLYETWHPLDEGDWLARIHETWETLWQPFLLAPAIRAAGAPVRVVPAGTAMARLIQEVEATPGGIGGMMGRADLFSDQIHLNDLGAYMVALTHYAVLYSRSPEGLPHRLLREDGSPAEAPSAQLAAVMQRIVWDTVQSSPLSW